MTTQHAFAAVLATFLSTGLAACGGAAPDAGERQDVGAASAALGTNDWSVTPSQGLRIGSWNLKRLGQGDKRLDLVAQVIERQFDVISLEEVMSAGAVQPLLAQLPGWSAQVSERAVGRNGYYEYYAVLYRTGQSTVTSSQVVADPADEWYREPMVTCLRSGTFDYCLVTTHIVFGDTVGPRDAEIQALGRLVSGLRAAGAEQDYIVLGDFNRAGKAPGFSTLLAGGFQLNDDGAVKTTVGTTSYGNPYDHALLATAQTIEWTGVSGRHDLVSSVCGGSFAFCAASVSDHAPIGLLFDATVADDD